MKFHTPSKVPALSWNSISSFCEGLYAEITKSCLTAPPFETCLKVPCFLSKTLTSATTNPADCKASCIVFHTLFLEL